MLVKDVLLYLLRKNLKGVQLFRKGELPAIIKHFNLAHFNEIEMKDDTLVIHFDDDVLHVKLTWKQFGPRNTLIGIDWKSD